MAGAMPTESDIRRAAELRLSTLQSLGTIGLRPETLGSDHYVRLLSTMLNWSPDAGWHDQITPECDPNQLIRDQLFDFDNSLRVDARGLWLGDKRVKTLSVKRFPDRIPRFGGGLLGRCAVRDAGHPPEHDFDPDSALPRRGGHPRIVGCQAAMGGQPSLRANPEVPAAVGHTQAQLRHPVRCLHGRGQTG